MLQSAPGSRVGTPAYLAPEIITASRDNTYDGKAGDVWACGVMLFVMLCARYPFRRPEDEQLQPSNKLHVMLKRILQVQYELPDGLVVSDACRDLLRRILVADPRERIGIDGIMAHPWFQTNLPPGVVEMNAELVPEDVMVVGQHFPGQQVRPTVLCTHTHTHTVLCTHTLPTECGGDCASLARGVRQGWT